MAGGSPGAARSKNSDVDEAELPTEIKELIKRIREIREQLAEKQAELREVMTDDQLRPDVRKMKASVLQSEIMSLTSAFMLTSRKFTQVLQELKLDSEQALVAGQLLMA